MPLDLAPGQTLTDLNLTMVKARVSRVSGRVVNQTGSRPQSVQVFLSPVPMFARQVLGVVNEQGEFEFNSVPLGDYTLIALVTALPSKTGSVHQAITVGREPLENQILSVPPPIEISGIVRAEGDAKDLVLVVVLEREQLGAGLDVAEEPGARVQLWYRLLAQQLEAVSRRLS